jgi:pimeloyl-ACP methyl ester carboxylesterase
MAKSIPPFFNQTLINIGSGPVVILLHGLFGNYRMWSKTVEALQSDYHVVIPRLPIFDLPIQNTNVKYLVKVLHDFIEWHNFKEVSLVGHAMGGQVALMYTYLNPDHVSKLIITGSTGLLNTPLTDDSLTTKNFDHDFVYDMVSQAFYEENPMLEYFVEEIYLTVQNIPNRLMIGSLIKSSRQNEVTHFLNKIDTPTLLIWGLQDKLSPPEIALHFHDYLRNSELKFIKECGHIAMFDKPSIFNQHLISFLK